MNTDRKAIVLSIAGSDSGGGAGIQADLKTFSHFGVFGTTVVTCITAQNPEKISGILDVHPDLVRKQLISILGYYHVDSIKTGMLFSKQIIHTIADVLKKKLCKLVVDPVMVSASKTRLLQEDAIEALVKELIPLASVITPNIDEAEILIDEKITSVNQLEDTAKKLYDRFGVPVLLKGGHLHDGKVVKDILKDAFNTRVFSNPYIENVNTHGSGCTYSSAIASELALGKNLEDSVLSAKEYLWKGMKHSVKLGPIQGINHNP
ncbi:MAG: bifunctional hydroxymethylpyrimidine kinase/phosphomethylpyrimidine kinase [Leptospiraceae bacterium]|nr:bifunctional hydroxymethylpyrimidine kinase/phosphomethylpyrimidine kinase [Leptospiraceae bacterium]MCP5499019.1 bifunctional hydroxymethylpyrimidine kinase/phosphomethylpyrimidine kinase [Leptospiraceae bacterium]